MNSLIFCLHQNRLLAFAIKDGRTIQALPIQGEADWFSLQNANSLKTALRDIQERLAQRVTDEQPVCLLYDQASAPLLDGYAQWRTAIAGQWEWLRWERIQALVKADLGQHPRAYLVKESVIPLVLQTLHAAAHPDQDATPSAQLGDIDTLRARCQSLAAQLQQCQLQRPLGGSLEGEQLLAFLPALYAQVFNTLNGADLAMLLGRVEPLHIPSPYPEPSEETLDKKQREFRALAPEQQRQIVAFAQRASKRLRPRPKMQAIIADLEDVI